RGRGCPLPRAGRPVGTRQCPVRHRAQPARLRPGRPVAGAEGRVRAGGRRVPGAARDRPGAGRPAGRCPGHGRARLPGALRWRRGSGRRAPHPGTPDRRGPRRSARPGLDAFEPRAGREPPGRRRSGRAVVQPRARRLPGPGGPLGNRPRAEDRGLAGRTTGVDRGRRPPVRGGRRRPPGGGDARQPRSPGRPGTGGHRGPVLPERRRLCRRPGRGPGAAPGRGRRCDPGAARGRRGGGSPRRGAEPGRRPGADHARAGGAPAAGGRPVRPRDRRCALDQPAHRRRPRDEPAGQARRRLPHRRRRVRHPARARL
ncbi:MAG: hypothetical protein AVDCRST_MAG49-3355, partial [uncultured Thermomicrobiales bacterium]